MSSAAPVPLRVLFVEDSEIDYEVMKRTLAAEGFALESLRVDEAAPMRDALASGAWDAVICDYYMPQFSAVGALAVLRESKHDLPFVVVSSESGEETAVEAMLAGADDYIMKERPRRIAPALRRSLQSAAVRREKAAAVAALRDSERRLRDLTGYLEAAKEAERAAVATEIGEKVGTSLTALKFELAWLRRHGALEPEATARLGNALALVDDAALAAQRVVGDLRPSILDLGIVPALEWLTTQFARNSGIETRFDANLEVVADPEISIEIYRFCQAALSNVARHSGALRAEVNLFANKSRIDLEVTDNGQGIPAAGIADTTAPAFGFAAMRERARRLNGTLEISSGEGKGTTILLSLPRSRTAASENAR